jgi:hypothetical protein
VQGDYLSTIHPVAFLDSIYSNELKQDGKSVAGQDLERWHVLLGHFRIVVFPLEEGKKIIASNELEQMIHEETYSTHFLNKMGIPAMQLGNYMKDSRPISSAADELAVKLQMSSHYFYMYMWQSLTKEEKFLLYDLAEDNLVKLLR